MASIADVYVTVLPETGKLANGIEKALRDADKHVTAAAQRWKEEIDKALTDFKVTVDANVKVDGSQVEKEVEKETGKRKPKVEVDVEVDGRQVEKEVEKEGRKRPPKVPVKPEADKESMSKLQKEAEALLSNLEIDVNETIALNKIKKLKSDITKSLSKVGVSLDERIAEGQLRKLRSETARLLNGIDVEIDPELAEKVLGDLFGDETIKVDIDFDPARAKGSLGPLYGMFAGKLGGSITTTIEPNVDIKKAEAALTKLHAEAAYTLSRIGVDLDNKAAYKKLLRLREQGQDLIGKLDVDLDTKSALAALHGLGGQQVTVTADADTAKAEGQLDLVSRDRHVNIGVDTDALARTAAQISGVLAESGTSALAELGTQLVEGIGKQASRLTQLHPVLAVGAIGAAAGLIVDLLGVVAELSGAIALIPAGIFSAVAAFGTLKLATAGFTDALKEMGDPEKFATALQTLTPAAQQAALSIKSIMDTAITPLQNQLQETLFANVGPQLINTVNAILPAITPALTGIAAAFNSMFQQVMTLLQDPETVGMLATMLGNIQTAFELLGPGVSAFLDAMIRLGDVGSSFLPGIASGLTNAAQSFANFIAEAQANGSLQEFIQSSIDGFNQLLPLLPQILNAFMALAPIGEALLPGIIKSIEIMLPLLVQLSYVLVFLGPNFTMLDGVLQTVSGSAVDTSGKIDVLRLAVEGLISPVKMLIDLFNLLPGAASNATDKMNAAVANAQAGLPQAPLSSFPTGAQTGAPGAPRPAGTGAMPPPKYPGAPVDTAGNIVGTYIPFVPPPGYLEPGSAGPPSRGGGGVTPRDRFGNPVVPPPAGPVPLAPPGGIPVPAPPPPKVAGGGGGGGAGAKPEAVSPVPGAPYTYGGFGELNWEALAEAEAGGNWSMNNGNGFYGGLQFDLGTWNEYGGQQFAERPDLASKSEQIKVATALYNKRKAAPWPANGWLLTATDEQLRNAGLTSTGKPSSRGGGGGGAASDYYRENNFFGPGGGGGSGGYGRSGGQIPSVVDRFAQSVSGNAYKWGGVGEQGLYDCSGFMSDIYGMLTGKPYQGNERYFTTKSSFEALGFQPGNMPGAFNISVTPEHMVGQLPSGVAVEAGGQTGQGATYGGKARSTLPGGKSYYLPADQVPGGYGQYSYDGPGGDRNNPMYVQSAKDTGGAQLGKDMVSGIMEIFGLGDLFKDPTQFGLFKIFKGLAQWGTGLAGRVAGDQDNGYGNGSGGGGDAFFGGGGGGGGLVDSLMGLIPQPFGALNPGSPENAPGEFIPGISEGSGGGGVFGVLDQVLAAKPGEQQGQNVIDRSNHFEGANFGWNKNVVGDQLKENDMVYARGLSHSAP